MGDQMARPQNGRDAGSRARGKAHPLGRGLPRYVWAPAGFLSLLHLASLGQTYRHVDMKEVA